MKDIIPLGFNCGVTFSLQNLKIKKETSLFEWFRSDSLSSITKIIESIQNGIDSSIIIQKDNFVGYFDSNSDIYSAHYSLSDFKEIFIRRAQRFLDKIKSSKSIVFVRIEDLEFIKPCSAEDLENFKKSILRINPSLDFQYLLIDILEKKENFIIKNNCFLIHKYFLKEHKVCDSLQKDPMFYEFLHKELSELKCNMETTDKFFYDRS